MDKKSISIKVNGKDKPITDEIKNKSETKSEPKDFHWVLPEQQSQINKSVDVHEHQKAHVVDKQRNKSSPGSPRLPVHRKKSKTHQHRGASQNQAGIVKKQWLPAFSAVIVGVFMGMIVLTMFTNSKAQETSEQTQGNLEEANAVSSDKTSAVQNLNLHIIQGGAFSSKESASDTVNRLQNKGFPAVLHQADDKFYLFIGAAMKKPQAEKIGDLYKQKDQDVYIKTLQIQAHADDLKKETKKFLQKSRTVLNGLIKGSARGLISGETAFSNQQWQQFEQNYRQWQKSSKSQSLPSNGQALSKNMEKAVKHIQNNRKKPQTQQLWQAQKQLLKVALQYKDMV